MISISMHADSRHFVLHYQRLKDPARKAEYLAIALTNLSLSPSYALQKFGPSVTG